MNYRALAAALIIGHASTASACRFARDAKPAEWFQWSSALFAADVASVEADAKNTVDVIEVRVVETFKGPTAASAKLEVPSRMWASCLLERPSVGARVLVALNPNGDTLLMPLNATYADSLRSHRAAAR